NGREAAEFSVRNLLLDYYATPDTWRVAQALDTVLQAANRWLLAHARKAPDNAGMATTLTALVLRGARYYVAHVGDTRAYLSRSGRLTQLTEDHTWEHPELSNVLRRAIGLDAHLVVDHADGELRQGDRIVLLSDGVWATLGDHRIAESLARHRGADAAADALVAQAQANGSHDDCTALVAEVTAVAENGLRDTLAAVRRLPLPPRMTHGDEIDGLRVLELLHESRVTLLYKVARVAAPAGSGAGSATESAAESAAESRCTLVLKTLRPDAGDDEAIAALAHEEWLARRAPSPCFPQVVAPPARTRLYYLMAWQPGETLRARLARGHRFAPHEVADLGVRLLKGVAALHRLAIVHRDIKPDNLQLGPQGQLTILDLGVAASDSDEFREINNPGTPSYMAPELFAGRPAAESSDLYACGVTLFELLTRKYPYGEIEPFQNPRFGQPVPATRHRPDTPAWLEALLLKACAREPAERFETAEEFLLALERGAHRPLATPRRTPLAARNPSLALKLIAVASLLANLLLLALLKWK
ncbi:MAG TPA: bifunctional protein-serine/threonine kinase/phosphatase, partial [Burkholderiaceae bacterium]